MQDDVEMIKTLVEGGAHTDFRDRHGLTAQHSAAVCGNHRALKMMLDLGGSPDVRDAQGLTPLYHAVSRGSHIRCAEVLLRDKAEVGVTDHALWTEVHQAAKHGHDAHIEALAIYGCDLNARNQAGNTPLHICASWSQAPCALALLKHGADRDAKNKAGQTAFNLAALQGVKDVMEVLGQFVTETTGREKADRPVYFERSRSGSIKTVRGLAGRGGREIERAEGIIKPSNKDEVLGDSPAPGAQYVATTPPKQNLAGSRSPQVTLRRRTVTIPRSTAAGGFGFRLTGTKTSAATQTAEGQVVKTVDPDGPAAAAGLQAGDRLVSVNGTDVLYASHQRVVDLVRLTKHNASLVLVVGTVSGDDRRHQPPTVTQMPIIHAIPDWSSKGMAARKPLSEKGDVEPRSTGSDVIPASESPVPPPPPPPPPGGRPPPPSPSKKPQLTVLGMDDAHSADSSTDSTGGQGLASVLTGLGSVSLKKVTPPSTEAKGAGRVLGESTKKEALDGSIKTSKAHEVIRAATPLSTGSAGSSDPLAGILNVKLKKTPKMERKKFPIGTAFPQPPVELPSIERKWVSSSHGSAHQVAVIEKPMEVSDSKETQRNPPPVAPRRPSGVGGNSPPKPAPRRRSSVSDSSSAGTIAAAPPLDYPSSDHTNDSTRPDQDASPPRCSSDDGTELVIPPPIDFVGGFGEDFINLPSYDEHDNEIKMVPPPPVSLNYNSEFNAVSAPPPPGEFDKAISSLPRSYSDLDNLSPPPLPTPGVDDRSIASLPSPLPSASMLFADDSDFEEENGLGDSSIKTGSHSAVRSTNSGSVSHALSLKGFESPSNLLKRSDVANQTFESATASTHDPPISSTVAPEAPVKLESSKRSLSSMTKVKPLPSPPPPLRMAIAAFAFDATNQDELTFSPGTRLELLSTPGGGWWEGKIDEDHQGWFPSDYVRELIDPPGPRTPKMESRRFGSTSTTPAAEAFDIDTGAVSDRQLRRSQSLSTAPKVMKEVSASMNRSTSSSAEFRRKSSRPTTPVAVTNLDLGPAEDWDVIAVGKWLESVGFGEYRHNFEVNEIEGRHLLDMDKSDLKEMDVLAFGHRMELFKLICGLRPAESQQ